MKLFLNSILCSLMAVVFAVPAGLCVALGLSAARGALRGILYVACGAVLLVPPFLVTNSWLHLFGRAGRWSGTLPFDLYGMVGVGLLTAAIVWPVVALLVHAAWRGIPHQQLEADPMLSGSRLITHLLLRVALPALMLSMAIVFVLTFNQFSIPAILQVRVLPAEAWIAFSTNLDVGASLMLSLPLVALALMLLLIIRRMPGVRLMLKNETAGTTAVSDGDGSAVFRKGLGLGWTVLVSVGTFLIVAVSLGLPLIQLLSSPRTWSELVPAFQASRPAIVGSFVTAIVAASLVAGVGLLLAKRRFVFGVWLLFLVPGVFVGVVLSWLSNRPPVSWIYGTNLVVWIALLIRYLGIGWSGARAALQRTDRELRDAASLMGATQIQAFVKVFWPQIRGPVLILAYVLFLFCIWDVETGLLIVPPGGETAAMKVFNLLHYGHNAQVDALCVIMICVAALPVIGFALVSWARRLVPFVGMIAIAGLASGCGSGDGSDAPELESKFFEDVVVIGKRGTGAGEFNKPRSVALDHEDNLYVVDMTGRVQKFSEDGTFMMAWQMHETKLGRPKGMQCDSAGNIIVIEPHYARLNHFNADGELMRQWGKYGTNVGHFHLPRAVAERSDGRFVVSEFGISDRVQIFDANGDCVQSIGRPGAEDGEFDRPEGLGVDQEDRIYVADSCNHRVQVFDRDGTFLRTYGEAGSGVGQLSYPYDVRVDADGNQFVCEFGNSRIQVFDKDDQPIETIGRIGREPGEFFNPFAIAFDSKGNLYIADSQNHRVQKLIRRRDS